MIVGVGVDVVPVARPRATVERTPGLVDRMFAAGERGSPAARFAVEQSVAKASGAPAALRRRDVEVVWGVAGRPEVRTAGAVAAAAREMVRGVAGRAEVRTAGTVAAAAVRGVVRGMPGRAEVRTAGTVAAAACWVARWQVPLALPGGMALAVAESA